MADRANRSRILLNKGKMYWNGNIIVDGRNIYHREELEAEGFVYTTIGE